MSQKTAKLPYKQRKHVIKEHIVKETQEQIAIRCGVSRATINRDIQHLKDDGEWNEWLELFLLKLYASDEIDDDAKLRSVTTLYAKTMVQKTEVAGSLTTELKVVFDKSMDDNGEPSNPV